MTVKEVNPNDYLAVAVPFSHKFAELAERWRDTPLMQRCGIDILLVSPSGVVYGFDRVTNSNRSDAARD
jgi:hypothetical protein